MNPIPQTSAATPPSASKNGVVLLVALVFAASFGAVGYFMLWPEYQTNKILKNGVLAEGVITAIEPTGNYYNDQPQALITIEVRSTTTSGPGSTFTTHSRKVINPIYAPLFQPGKRVQIRYLPNDPDTAAIESVESATF